VSYFLRAMSYTSCTCSFLIDHEKCKSHEIGYGMRLNFATMAENYGCKSMPKNNDASNLRSTYRDVPVIEVYLFAHAKAR